MKGIILAGGTGTRLYPLTKIISKHLLPIYDKPMIYYPLSVLMLAGIREILIISTNKDIKKFEDIFGNGQDLGIEIKYAIQSEPKGIAEAFIIGETFIGKENVALILGDNIFYGQGFVQLLERIVKSIDGATILAYYVKDPERFGVVEFDETQKVLSLEEKPNRAKSHYVVTGLYFYDNSVMNIAKGIKPSQRGEIEITAINQAYLSSGRLKIELLGRGFAWLDAGTYSSLLEASQFIEVIEKRQGLKIACLEEIAFRKGYIDKNQLARLVENMPNTEYYQYIQKIIEGK